METEDKNNNNDHKSVIRRSSRIMSTTAGTDFRRKNLDQRTKTKKKLNLSLSLRKKDSIELRKRISLVVKVNGYFLPD